VQHAVIITPFASGNRLFPQRLDELTRYRCIGANRHCSVRCSETRRRTLRRRRAVDLVGIGISSALRRKEVQEAITELDLSRIFGEPRAVHRPIHAGAKGVVPELDRVWVPRGGFGCAIEMGVIRRKPGFGVSRGYEEVAAGGGGLTPKSAICLRPPQRPQLVERSATPVVSRVPLTLPVIGLRFFMLSSSCRACSA
jgi:hypothetical protein